MRARYCVRCGTATAPHEEGGRTRARCPACGWTDYENPKPAVGAVVERGGRVLLSRRARQPHRGLWDLPGGFLEAGEAPEEALLRELGEETGMQARVVRLLHVAPGEYAGSATLNLVYLCEAEGEPVASDDSAELAWHAPGALPPMAFPHEVEALARWRKGA